MNLHSDLKITREPFSFELFLRDTFHFLGLWLILFFFIRVFTFFGLNLPGNELFIPLICGAGYDTIGFSFVWAIWSVGQLFLQHTCIGRWSTLIIIILVSAIGLCNAIFILWAYEPLSHEFLTYISDLDNFTGSASRLLPEWYWLLLMIFGLLLVFVAAVIGTRSSNHHFQKNGSHLLYALMIIFSSVILLSLIFNKFFPFLKEKPYSAITCNIFHHEMSCLFFKINRRLYERAFEKKDDSTSVTFIRESLIQDQGHLKFIDKEFPLMKYNFSFSKPLNRKEIWDHRLKKRPNIVILFMESFRARDIGVYGSKENLTPNFDDLAAQGWLWTNFYANGTQTPRGALSTLTSMYPYIGKSIQRTRPNFPLRGLAGILREYGYQTEFYHNGSLEFDKKEPFFRNLGFETILGDKDLNPQNKYRTYGWGFPDEDFAKLLAKRINRQPSRRPLFITAFTVSHHHPWVVPDPHFKIIKKEVEDQYVDFRNSMHYSDHALGVFFTQLNKDVLNRTLFFILADTATPMGEHHNNFILIRYLYEENLRIPFLIYGPGFIKKGRRFTDISSQVDIMPTILDMLDVKTYNHAIGKSLLTKIDSPYAFFSNPYFESWIGLRFGKYKYIYQFKDRLDFLYDLEMDPLEQTNLSSIKPNTVSRLKKLTFEKMRSSQILFKRNRVWRDF